MEKLSINKIHDADPCDHRIVKISSCTLNQWAMDFEGNKQRIIQSIIKSKAECASIRIGPELEISGYGCEDHFLELDTINHSWEVLAEIINYKTEEESLTKNILCDIGMPVLHHGIIYNCRILVYNSEIKLIRPKIAMADDGNYRENRWFTPWCKGYVLEDFSLPQIITNSNDQKSTKIGIGVVFARDLSYAPEICEELWIPYSPSIDFTMHGCEIIGNSSGSHFQINKQDRRFELIANASKKNGGAYIYSNLIGCDGGRLYFDGGSFIAFNGKILSEGDRFILDEVQITVATVDLNEVCSYRNSIKSRCSQSSQNEINVPIISIDEYIIKDSYKSKLKFNPFDSITPKKYIYEEEMRYAPSCWLWDYLRRSGASGYFIALSGGSDSACVAVMVGLLCRNIYEEISKKNNSFVLKELRKIVKDERYNPKSAEEICGLILVTNYMGTKFSSEKTKNNASSLAEEIGAYHLDIQIDKIFDSIKEVFTNCVGNKFNPKFLSEGGTIDQDLALQNIQARIRMIMSYLMAGLVPWTRQRKGFLLVLASGNLDEGITGYLTKYDCSSADLNPIGSISKIRLKKFLQYCLENENINIKSLANILKMKPTAELRPSEGLSEDKLQNDEDDIGLTFEELSLMGQLRKDFRCGPYSMFRRLVTIWDQKDTAHILNKVKLFFRRYSINRHKMTTITPSLHCESYALDDNRFDLRQFLYNNSWTYQFNHIDKFSQNGNTINENIIKLD